MTALTYIPGQRWVSSTELELGLGIIVDNNNRLVIVSFPAAGEQRTYAIDNAPLNRVEYLIGDQVSNADGLSITITERQEKDLRFFYTGVDEAGNTVILDELDLDSHAHFSKPQDRLFAGQIDKNSSFELRLETLNHFHRHQQTAGYGLLGPRVQLLPHQFYIAHQVAQRHAPRVLLADEVGLGKTIEAGLILHHQLISGRAERVIIVVPDSLVHQWLVEMLRRFNLHFTILDEERCTALEESGEENPFESAQWVLCSLSFLQNDFNRQVQALDAQWDLLIVDEAHHLSWNETETSPAYQCIEALARQIAGLLLLTATPEQLGVESHFARLRLLDPDRYHDLAKFREEESGYQAVSQLVQALLSDDIEDTLNDSAVTDPVIHYLGEDSLKQLQAATGDALNQTVAEAVQSLLDRHGTGRVLFRNTRDAVKGFPERVLHPYPLPAPDSYRSQSDDAPLECLLHPELLLGEDWLVTDPRVSWLVDWLKQRRDEKVLIICALAETAQDLEKYLRLNAGVRSAVFHEHLTLVARDRAAAYFGEEEEEGAQVLICSEIGSEGRNFQFAHNLLLFDLPLNPDLLEQRIGRLDRIGQRHTVKIHAPYYEASAQAVLLRWYQQGINAFERVCPAGGTLFESLGETLQACLRNSNDSHALDSLIDSAQTQTTTLMQTLQQGRNRLLELSSCNSELAADVIEQVETASCNLQLETYMSKVFDHFGVDQQPHSAHSIVLHPGDHMQCDNFPCLPEDGVTATYQRSQALIREDMLFLTWEHPMVTDAMDMALSGDFGNSTLCTLSLPTLKPGTLLLEAIFTIHCPAPKQLQLQRYLSKSLVRIVVDSHNKDLAHILTEEQLNRRAQRVPRHSAQELIRHTRAQITELVTFAEQLAEVQLPDIIATAQQQAAELHQTELQRLTALAEVNTTIRGDEIEHLRDHAQLLHQHLASAQLKLDALRVAITTE